MKKKYTVLALLIVLSSCATYTPKYLDSEQPPAVTEDKEILHTFYLIGDAGLSPIGGMNPALKIFKNRLNSASENSTAIFLGDNIYPAGLPDPKDSTLAYLEAKSHLDAQLKTLDDFKGKPVFIPGNHDWYTQGLVGLERQEKYIQEMLGDKNSFLPKNGCPIEVVDVNNQLAVIVIDTQWYLTNWDKRPDINDKCDIKSRQRTNSDASSYDELWPTWRSIFTETTILS
jgi:hypothetical protein